MSINSMGILTLLKDKARLDGVMTLYRRKDIGSLYKVELIDVAGIDGEMLVVFYADRKDNADIVRYAIFDFVSSSIDGTHVEDIMYEAIVDGWTDTTGGVRQLNFVDTELSYPAVYALGKAFIKLSERFDDKWYG